MRHEEAMQTPDQICAWHEADDYDLVNNHAVILFMEDRLHLPVAKKSRVDCKLQMKMTHVKITCQ